MIASELIKLVPDAQKLIWAAIMLNSISIIIISVSLIMEKTS